MTDKRTPRRRGSQTGMMHRVDVEPDAAHESPRPPTLPELDGEMTSITGQVPLLNEGEDEAKNADDSATTDDQQPRQTRARRQS